MSELKYSLDAKCIQGIFKSCDSDLVVYTEDENCCNIFYETLFNRLGSEIGLKIKTVQLGSCDVVQKSCEDDLDDSYAKLYMVDGDLFLMYNPKDSKENFFPLDRYCIENFLCDLNAVVELAYRNNGTKDKETLKQELDYNGIMQSLAKEILPIYHRNAVLKCLKGVHSNKGFGYFFNSQKKCFDGSHIACEKKDIEKEICSFVKNRAVVPHLLDEIERNCPCNISNALKYLSGKDCILSYLLIQLGLKTNTHIGMNRDSVKLCLAEHCDLKSFSSLIDKLKNVYEHFNEKINSHKSL